MQRSGGHAKRSVPNVTVTKQAPLQQGNEKKRTRSYNTEIMTPSVHVLAGEFGLPDQLGLLT